MIPSETVTRLRGVATTDPYSGEETLVDWSTPTELDIVTIAPAEPRPVPEFVQDARNSRTNGYTLYLPEGSDVLATDRMRVRGEVLEIDGPPAAWLGAGLVVQVKRTEG